MAVNDVSLEIREKEFLVLLGPSGCGKTTTLRCIAGLEMPDKGEIYIEDVLVNNLSPKERDVAMVFQSYALYPHMSVYDNIAFPLKMRKFSKNDVKRMVEETADVLKIKHLLDRKPRQLSGGEAQRVAVGRAIVRKPKVFLMDEPLSNLDAKLRLYMRGELKRLQKDLHITTIYVTHDQVEAMTMADRIAIMNSGVLQQLDPPSKIYSFPSNPFVASFIGSPPMNLIDVTCNEKNGSLYLNAEGFSISVPDSLGNLAKAHASAGDLELTLGIRPEDISLHKTKVEKDCIKAEVFILEPLGSEVIIDLNVGNKIIRVKTTPDFETSIGDEVWMTINKDRIYLFDKKGAHLDVANFD